MSYKSHFSRFFEADPSGRRLHFAAHSHHYWPDASWTGHNAYWTDAARLVDGKWAHIFGTVVPEAQGHVARLLRLPDPNTVAFAPNTHDFIVRLFSCFPDTRPVQVLTTDGEFHSFSRQVHRMEEAGLVDVTRIPVAPFDSFAARFREAVLRLPYDLLFFSHVLYNSGFVVPDLAGLVAAVPRPEPLVVIDGYHSFMALPVDLSALADRAFYMSGGYKYVMAGEGAGLMHCPPGYGTRPVASGWFATFGELEKGYGEGAVPYSKDGFRFWGATFDAGGLYRFNAVQRWLQAEGLTIPALHAQVQGLQAAFLDRLETAHRPDLRPAHLIPPAPFERGHFLTFRIPHAGRLHDVLAEHHIITDYRADRLRFGFALYHDQADIDRLFDRLAEIPPVG